MADVIPHHDEWPDFPGADWGALHQSIENEIVRALDHCYASADAAGMNWTTSGWVSVSASNILSWMKRMGLPAPSIPRPEPLYLDDVHREWSSEWSPDEGSPWEMLKAWAAEDRESRVLDVKVTAEDPEYDPGGEIIVEQPYHVQIDAWDGGHWYGDERHPRDQAPEMSRVFTGYGADLDDAAERVLELMVEVREGEPT